MMQSTKPKQFFRTAPWFAADGDNTLRLDYPLSADSIVFDVGGYLGLSTEKVFNKFGCTVYVFEPVKEFADKISEKFAGNPKIKVFNIGLAGKTRTATISAQADASSEFRGDQGMDISLVKMSEFLAEHRIERIDLLEINIEGGEYELLQDLIDTGDIIKVKNIQVQFHDFVDGAEAQMRDIKRAMSKTHYPTFAFEFVWENWRLIPEMKDMQQAEALRAELLAQIEVDNLALTSTHRDNNELRAEVGGWQESGLAEIAARLERVQTEVAALKQERDSTIQELRNVIHSPAYKLGYALLHPWRVPKALLKRIKHLLHK